MFQNFEAPATGVDVAGRLAAVRARLAEAGFDGMLVPRADAHQNETVAPADERLAWLTGFTGSAGIALVLPERAGVAVDGRYTLQAARQCDGDAFEVVASQETPPERWLADAAPEGAVIAYDPWLHGRAELARFRETLEARGLRLAPLAQNPVDRLWEDRPARPMGAVRLHPEALAGDTAADKRARLARGLAEAGVAAAVLTRPDGIAWLLNIRGADLSHVPVALGFAILHADASVDLFMEGDKIDGPVAEALGTAVRIAAPSAFLPALDALGGRRVRLDQRGCAMAVADRLEAAGAEIDWGDDPTLLPKACKTPAELAGMRAAHLRDGAALARFLAWLDARGAAGETLDEIAIAKKLEAFRADTGRLNDISFDTICGAGEHGAIVHYRVTRATNRALAPGEVLLVDSGGQYPDGTTDVTRTIGYGTAPEAARRPFTLVLKGMIALARARWPEGLAGRDLDALARAALWEAGLDYDHGTGHGVGAALDVHEGPAGISRRSGRVALRPGMILSDEPGYYRAGEFGIRIENLLAVTPAAVPEGGERAMLGFETLTLAPIDRRMILPELLTPAEAAWLDAYHARVRSELSGEVDAETAAFLARACAPIAEGGGLR